MARLGTGLAGPPQTRRLPRLGTTGLDKGMNELLSLAIKAHGGLDRWNTVASVQAATSITGAIWYLKGKPDVLKNVIATAETRTERVTMTFVGQDKESTFEPDRVV